MPGGTRQGTRGQDAGRLTSTPSPPREAPGVSPPTAGWASSRLSSPQGQEALARGKEKPS